MSFLSNEIIVSILQFTGTASNIAWGRYQQIYLLNQGLSVTEIAIITPFRVIFKSLGYAFWSYMVDITNKFKLVYTISAGISFGILLLFFIDIFKSVLFNSKYFILFNIIRCLRSFCNASWVLIDAISMELIKDKKSFGQHKLFASFAWGICSLIVGYMIDYFGYNSIIIYQFIGFIFIALFVNTLIPDQISSDMLSDNETRIDNNDPQRNNDYYTVLKYRFTAIKNDSNFMFCLVLIFVYHCAFVISNYITYIQYKKDFNVHVSYIGRFMFISAASEYPLLFFSKNILNNFNPNKILLFSHIILCIRLIGHTLITIDNINYVYLLELLHGFCFALPMVTLRVYFHKKATAYSSKDVNIISSIQSILGIITSLAHGFGAFFWSEIYAKKSAFHVYFFGCIILLPSIAIMLTSVYDRNALTLFNDVNDNIDTTNDHESERLMHYSKSSSNGKESTSFRISISSNESTIKSNDKTTDNDPTILRRSSSTQPRFRGSNSSQ